MSLIMCFRTCLFPLVCMVFQDIFVSAKLFSKQKRQWRTGCCMYPLHDKFMYYCHINNFESFELYSQSRRFQVSHSTHESWPEATICSEPRQPDLHRDTPRLVKLLLRINLKQDIPHVSLLISSFPFRSLLYTHCHCSHNHSHSHSRSHSFFKLARHMISASVGSAITPTTNPTNQAKIQQSQVHPKHELWHWEARLSTFPTEQHARSGPLIMLAQPNWYKSPPDFDFSTSVGVPWLLE